MNERQEQTADVLGKLTVLGTIVLPMNIVTGMWGMNVLVPGQNADNLYWFWSSKSNFASNSTKRRSNLLADHSLSHCRLTCIWRFMLLHRKKSVWDCLRCKRDSDKSYAPSSIVHSISAGAWSTFA